MKQGLFLLFCMVFVSACGSKKEDAGDAGFFPVVSYLQSQVRHVDTSLYSITKIRKAHGVQDTAYLKREEFRAAAQDFIQLPDIASTDLNKGYTETKLYDPDLKMFVFTYMPKAGEAAGVIRRQDVLIEPNSGSGDQVQTIYIETVSDGGDSTVQKKLTWNTAGSFQVLKLINKAGQPEQVETTQVRWTGGR